VSEQAAFGQLEHHLILIVRASQNRVPRPVDVGAERFTVKHQHRALWERAAQYLLDGGVDAHAVHAVYSSGRRGVRTPPQGLGNSGG
jgi:hypothetical protein